MRHLRACGLLLVAGVLLTLPVSPTGAADTAPSLDTPVGDALPLGDEARSIGQRALVVPRREAMLSASLDGRILEMPVRPGEPFEAGATLVSFDCSRLEAELRGRRAEARAAGLDLKAKRQQLAYNSIGEIEVALAAAEMEGAQARVAALEADAKGCTITAPYAGRVAAFEANPHETVKAGEDLLSILDDRTLEVEVIVPSQWLSWLDEGQVFHFKLDETGSEHPVTVSRVAARVEPASQSVRLTGVFQQAPEAVRPGMSGAAQFHPPGMGAAR